MSQDKPPHTQNERMIVLETSFDFLKDQLNDHGNSSSAGISALSAKLDALDAKWDKRFLSLEQAHLTDAKELQALKNKGAGVLAALGVIFTVIATVFSDFFSAIKHAITG